MKRTSKGTHYVVVRGRCLRFLFRHFVREVCFCTERKRTAARSTVRNERSTSTAGRAEAVQGGWAIGDRYRHKATESNSSDRESEEQRAEPPRWSRLVGRVRLLSHQHRANSSCAPCSRNCSVRHPTRLTVQRLPRQGSAAQWSPDVAPLSALAGFSLSLFTELLLKAKNEHYANRLAQPSF